MLIECVSASCSGNTTEQAHLSGPAAVTDAADNDNDSVSLPIAPDG